MRCRRNWSPSASRSAKGTRRPRRSAGPSNWSAGFASTSTASRCANAGKRIARLTSTAKRSAPGVATDPAAAVARPLAADGDAAGRGLSPRRVTPGACLGGTAVAAAQRSLDVALEVQGRLLAGEVQVALLLALDAVERRVLADGQVGVGAEDVGVTR